MIGDGEHDLDELRADGMAAEDELRSMWEAQRSLGRKAMDLAIRALDNADPSTIPVNVAVQLLKLGADLERRAMLGIEPDDDDDPFAKLAGSS